MADLGDILLVRLLKAGEGSLWLSRIPERNCTIGSGYNKILSNIEAIQLSTFSVS